MAELAILSEPGGSGLWWACRPPASQALEDHWRDGNASCIELASAVAVPAVWDAQAAVVLKDLEIVCARVAAGAVTGPLTLSHGLCS